MYIPKNVKALETGSGIDWNTWLEFLEPHKKLDHTEMAKVVLAEILRVGRSKSPEWWAQGVTIAFEQSIGRRKAGERSDGKFAVTVSATIDADMDKARDWWERIVESSNDIQQMLVDKSVRKSETDKWRYWRADCRDGSKLSVNFQTKPAGDKTTMSINHDALPGESDLENMRTFWKSIL